MKTHNPNPDLWSKIIEKKRFDQQLHKNIEGLPIIEPNTEIWGKIEKELDQSKKIVIWNLGAAVVAMLLIFSGTAYLLPSRPIQRTSIPTEKNQVNNPKKSIEIKETDPSQKMHEEKTISKLSLPRLKKTITPQRETIKPILLEPKLPATFKTIPALAHSGLEIQRSKVALKNTYHEVKISWTAEKPASQLSLFGRNDKVHVANTNYSKASIQVKLIKPKN